MLGWSCSKRPIPTWPLRLIILSLDTATDVATSCLTVDGEVVGRDRDPWPIAQRPARARRRARRCSAGRRLDARRREHDRGRARPRHLHRASDRDRDRPRSGHGAGHPGRGGLHARRPASGRRGAGRVHRRPPRRGVRRRRRDRAAGACSPQALAGLAARREPRSPATARCSTASASTDAVVAAR